MGTMLTTTLIKMRMVPMFNTRRLVVAAAVAGRRRTGTGRVRRRRSGEASGPAGAIEVEASFYPLAWITERVGGEHVTVHSLTKAGAEPHDLELSPSDVADVLDADLVVYLDGFQPAVDDAVGQVDGGRRFDAADAGADLDLRFTPIEEGTQHDDEAGTLDPHFWLDTTRLAAVAGRAGGPPGRPRPRPRRGLHRQRAGPRRPTSPPSTLVRDGPGRLRQPPSSSPATTPSATWPAATTSSRSASPGSPPRRSRRRRTWRR